MTEKIISQANLDTPERLVFYVAAGDASGRVLYRSTSTVTAEQGSKNPISVAGIPPHQWQWISYEHKWACDIFNNCSSWLSWKAFIKNTTTGSKIIWDHIEVGALNSPDEPFNETTIGQRGFYHYIDGPAEDFSLYWHKDGKDVHFQTGAKCWLSNSWVFISWHSQA